MNKKEIVTLLDSIGDAFVEEAAVVRKKKQRKRFYFNMAACFCLLFAVGMLLLQRHNTDSVLTDIPSATTVTDPSGYRVDSVTQPVQPTSAIQQNTPPVQPSAVLTTQPIATQTPQETAAENVTQIENVFPENGAAMLLPKWNEQSISQQFAECSIDGIIYRSQVTPLATEKAGTYLCDVTMEGYDIYEDKYYTKQALVYTIKDILWECAVAVRFEDAQEYYVYINTWYKPQTLGELVEALQLTDTLLFREAYIYRYTQDFNTTVVFSDFDDSLVWTMLLDDLSVQNNPDFIDTGDRYLYLSVDIPLLGYKDISMCVTKEGYVTTNILSTYKCFYVGKEKAQEFINTIEKTCPYVEEKVRVQYFAANPPEQDVGYEVVMTSEP